MQAHLEMLGLKQFVLQVDEIEVVMPNQHYFTIDMTKMGLQNEGEVSRVVEAFKVPAQMTVLLTSFPTQVLLPLDNPSGNITGTVRRKQRAKL